MPVHALALLALSLVIACKQPDSAPAGAAALPPATRPPPTAESQATGTLEGTVRLPGVPAPRPLPTNASAERACGAQVADLSLRLGVDGALRDVVAWVDAPPST